MISRLVTVSLTPCSICLDGSYREDDLIMHHLNGGELHPFHRSCLNRWIETSLAQNLNYWGRSDVACPTCRQIIYQREGLPNRTAQTICNVFIQCIRRMFGYSVGVSSQPQVSILPPSQQVGQPANAPGPAGQVERLNPNIPSTLPILYEDPSFRSPQPLHPQLIADPSSDEEDFDVYEDPSFRSPQPPQPRLVADPSSDEKDFDVIDPRTGTTINSYLRPTSRSQGGSTLKVRRRVKPQAFSPIKEPQPTHHHHRQSRSVPSVYSGLVLDLSDQLLDAAETCDAASIQHLLRGNRYHINSQTRGEVLIIIAQNRDVDSMWVLLSHHHFIANSYCQKALSIILRNRDTGCLEVLLSDQHLLHSDYEYALRRTRDNGDLASMQILMNHIRSRHILVDRKIIAKAAKYIKKSREASYVMYITS